MAGPRLRAAMASPALILAACLGACPAVARAQVPGATELEPAPAGMKLEPPDAAPPLDGAVAPVSAPYVLEAPPEITPGGSRLVPLDPPSAAQHVARGCDHLNARRFKEALAEFSIAVQLDDHNAEALAGRAQARYAYDESALAAALADCEAALRLDPKCRPALACRGIVRTRRQQYDEAIADLDALIREGSKDATLFLTRAAARLGRGEVTGAMADIDEAIRINPSSPNGYLLRSRVLTQQDQLENAMTEVTAALSRDAKSHEAYVVRGGIWLERGEYAKALADLEQAVRLNAGLADAHLALAGILSTCPDPKFRNGKKAVEHAEAFRTLSLRNPAPGPGDEANDLSILAAAHAEAGDFDRAIEIQTRANTITKDDVDRKAGESILKLYRDHKPYHLEE